MTSVMCNGKNELLLGGTYVLLNGKRIMLGAATIFPQLVGIGWGLTRTVRWNTIVLDAVSGTSTRLGLWSEPLNDFELTYDFLHASPTGDVGVLQGIFNRVQGAHTALLLLWLDDCVVYNQQIGVGDGNKTAFQLQRTLGGASESIFAPSLVDTIRVDGTSVNFTVNDWVSGKSPGVANLDTAPPPNSIITVDVLSYYWPVVFDVDQLDFNTFARLLYEVKSVKLRGVRQP